MARISFCSLLCVLFALPFCTDARGYVPAQYLSKHKLKFDYWSCAWRYGTCIPKGDECIGGESFSKFSCGDDTTKMCCIVGAQESDLPCLKKVGMCHQGDSCPATSKQIPGIKLCQKQRICCRLPPPPRVNVTY